MHTVSDAALHLTPLVFSDMRTAFGGLGFAEHSPAHTCS
jgi:hypothetical protein